jgi:L-seryl-tRNA(Ser) seleniumtransferase
MRKSNAHLQSIPSVDAVLKRPEVARLAAEHGRTLCVFAVREALSRLRARLASGAAAVDEREITARVASLVRSLASPSLVRVVNATGVILHTNLGRAVLGEAVLADMAEVIAGYSNIEVDLESGGRGSRHDHVAALLRFLTGAEDVLVVNNNAAAIVLALSTLAAGREVIVSRGELIEIGGEFRIPEIMAASGCTMVEVGTTNRTRISDYEKAVTASTAVIFKAHKSNYAITGFVEEAPLEQCAALARKKRLPFVYDLGSGLLRKVRSLPLESEPDAASAVAAGADLVLFSGDKLLGGPQAGIIAGGKKLVARLGKAPLMRALRVGKLTMTALSSVCRSYLEDESLVKNNPTFAMLSQDRAEILKRAEALAQALAICGIQGAVESTQGQCGGGTLPALVVPSAAVVLDKKGPRAGDSLRLAAARLRRARPPVIAVLREGRLVFDMLAVAEADVPHCAKAIAAALGAGEP